MIRLISDPQARTKFNLLWLACAALLLAPVTMGFYLDRWYVFVAYVAWLLGWVGALMFSLGARITR